MANVHIPDDYDGNHFGYAKSHYATKILDASQTFARATYQHTKLQLREFEGARHRSAELNGCVFCENQKANWPTEGLKDFFYAYGGSYKDSIATHGPAPDESFYRAVAQWRTSPIFSDRERTAIELAEAMGVAPQKLPYDEDFWKRAKALFSDDELVDLTYSIGMFIGLGRALHALSLDGVCPASRGLKEAAA